ncbi:hypothetical protein Avbf_14916 [Armadillidium vulgare]|nr:hypothetical protein Avbf_14916 [Armadillidium vulgare]
MNYVMRIWALRDTILLINVRATCSLQIFRCHVCIRTIIYSLRFENVNEAFTVPLHNERKTVSNAVLPSSLINFLRSIISPVFVIKCKCKIKINISVLLLKNSKSRRMFKLCLSKIKVFDSCILHTRGSSFSSMEKGQRARSLLIEALNIIFNNYYLRAEVTSDLFVASGEGPKFFQNLHLSINVFLRIYELEIRAKRQPNLFSTKSCQLRR